MERLTQAEVARRTKRTRSAVNALIASGVPLSVILERPKGSSFRDVATAPSVKRTAANVEQHRPYNRDRYRLAHGIPLDAPIVGGRKRTRLIAAEDLEHTVPASVLGGQDEAEEATRHALAKADETIDTALHPGSLGAW